MYSILKRKGRKRKQKQGLPLLQQFASTMGLHRDFHQFQLIDINSALKFLTESFRFYENGPNFFSAGIMGIKEKSDLPTIPSENFTDDLLELLTDQSHFAFIQFLFTPLFSLKKKKSIKRKIKTGKMPKQFDVQKGIVGLSKTDVIQEYGEFLFSPRVLIVENTQKRLQNKLEQLQILFHSNGMKICQYSTFFNRFSHLRNLCLERKIGKNKRTISIDGFSLMKFISLPQRFHEGYILVPNKSEILEEDIQRFIELTRKSM
jgi:hypothetical protein